MSTSELNAVVTLVNRISPWLMVLQVVPDGWTMPAFNPGQYVTLGLFEAVARCDLAEPEPVPAHPHKLIRRAYCIASSPVNHEFLEFFIHLVPHGTLSPRLFALEIGERIALSDHVTGAFTFKHVPKDASVLLIATGTGLAPYLSMLSTHLRFDTQRRVAVLHGARNSWDLGYRSILMTMQHLRDNMTYVPVISRPENEPVPWPRATEHVQDIWKGQTLARAWGNRPTPKDTHVFLSGSPHMIDDMAVLLAGEGFCEHSVETPGQIHVERYWLAHPSAQADKQEQPISAAAAKDVALVKHESA
jgi:ferredoxin/flavodoxin---NADP+ reductase